MQLTEQKNKLFQNKSKNGEAKKIHYSRTESYIVNSKKDLFASANEIKILNNLKFSSKTVSRVLKNNNLQYKKMKSTLILKTPHKNRRVHLLKPIF